MADENIDYEIIKSLRKSNFKVTSISEDYQGISDEEVISLSLNPPKIILTEDKDFGEWVFSHKKDKISVIFLRYKHEDLNKIIHILIELLKSKGNQLIGKFATITEAKVRIKTLR